DDLNAEGPSYESAQAVMKDEAGNRSRPTSETDKPEPALQLSSLMNYSQNEINDLFDQSLGLQHEQI
ncbi:11033_t:CDS:2, partial [Gigaspora rosea]